MNDLNHMDVVPRIVDNNMKITKEQLKSENKKNMEYNMKHKNIQANILNDKLTNTPLIKNNSILSQKSKLPIINYNYVLIIVVIVLIVIIIYMIYLYYKEKKSNKVVVTKSELVKPVENYEQYIQEESEDELESLSVMSNTSSKLEPTEIIEEEEDCDVDSMISNIEISDISQEIVGESNKESNKEDYVEVFENVSNENIEKEDEINMNIVDKLQYDLRN